MMDESQSEESQTITASSSATRNSSVPYSFLPPSFSLATTLFSLDRAAFEWDFKEIEKTLSIVCTLSERLSVSAVEEAVRASTSTALNKTLRIFKALINRLTDKLARQEEERSAAKARVEFLTEDHERMRRQLAEATEEMRKLRFELSQHQQHSAAQSSSEPSPSEISAPLPTTASSKAPMLQANHINNATIPLQSEVNLNTLNTSQKRPMLNRGRSRAEISAADSPSLPALSDRQLSSPPVSPRAAFNRENSDVARNLVTSSTAVVSRAVLSRENSDRSLLTTSSPVTAFPSAEAQSQTRLRAEATRTVFERNFAKRRVVQGAQGEEKARRRPTLTELTRTKFADEGDPLRYVEEERIRVEALKLRNKLAQNRVEALDSATQRTLARLEQRLRVHALEVDSLRRLFAQLLEFKDGLESRLRDAGPAALKALSLRSGEISTRLPNKEKGWKHRYAVLTQQALYVWKDSDFEGLPPLVYIFGMRETQFGVRDATSGDFFAIAPTSARDAERDGVVFHSSAEDARAWSQHFADQQVHARDPLARFGLSQRESLLAALRAHDYALPMALLYFAAKKDEKSSQQATERVLDVFEGHGEALDFIRFVIEAELERTPSERDLLRENNVNSRVLKCYAQRTGVGYLRDTFGPILRDLAYENKDMEIFVSKLQDKSTSFQRSLLSQIFNSRVDLVGVNRTNLSVAFSRLLDVIVGSKDALPPALRCVTHHLWVAIKTRFPSAAPQSVGCFVFLRFLCPAIAVPQSAGILDGPPPPRLSRGLVLITKVLQNMSNDVRFGNKESDMLPLNSLMAHNMSRFVAFLTSISSVPSPTLLSV